MVWLLLIVFLVQSPTSMGRVYVSTTGRSAVAISVAQPPSATLRTALDAMIPSQKFIAPEVQDEFEGGKGKPMSNLLWLMTGQKYTGRSIESFVSSSDIKFGRHSPKSEVDDLLLDSGYTGFAITPKQIELCQRFSILTSNDYSIVAAWSEYGNVVRITRIPRKQLATEEEVLCEAWPTIFKPILSGAKPRSVMVIELNEQIGVCMQTDKFLAIFIIDASSLKTLFHACFLTDPNVRSLLNNGENDWVIVD